MPTLPPAHKASRIERKAWQRTGSSNTTRRGYGHQWQKLRKRILQRDCYLCQLCLAAGRPTLATEVDHIINKASGGTDHPDNLQSICTACHKAKTAREG